MDEGPLRNSEELDKRELAAIEPPDDAVPIGLRQQDQTDSNPSASFS